MRSLDPATWLAAFHQLLRVPAKTWRGPRLLLAAGLVLAGGVTAGHGQSALDGFDPNADGNIRTVVVQSDGKILIGGDFTTLSPNGGTPVMRNRIARLNPDGTLDTAFNPNANGPVTSMALQADGKILVGGDFTGTNSIGGETRNRIARLDATTGLADSFDPNANLDVRAIAVQPDGRILVGGDFFGSNSIGGQLRNRIARLDPVTGQADSFDPNADLAVNSIIVQPDGKIVAGGQFTNIGGQPRNRIARLDSMTGLADSFDPNASGEVKSIAVQADGRILAGGQFNNIGGQTRNYIARLDRTTGLADSFDPNASNPVYSLAVQSDGKILVGGVFFSIGGQTRSAIARLNPTTGLADAFDPSVDGVDVPIVYAIAVQADGKILTGGFFTNFAPNGGAPVPRNRIARLEKDGRLDRTLNLNMMGGEVYAIAVQPDGKILIGGGPFSSVAGVARENLARLNSDGTLDVGFSANTDGPVYAIAVQPDGKILVCGFFMNVSGVPRLGIARLDPVTGMPDSFDPNPNDAVLSLAIQEDGKILAGGFFTNIGGQTRNRIARLDPQTGLSDSFNPGATGGVIYSMAIQAEGKLVVGGSFTNFGGQLRNRIARVDLNTGLIDSFNPSANQAVSTVVLQPDGRILAGGVFTNIGGQARNRIARLDPVTGLADNFNPNANNPVFSIALQSDGKVLVSGVFFGANGIGGQSRNGIARLDAGSGLADPFDPNGSTSVVRAIALQRDGKLLAGGGFDSMGGQPRNRFARLTNDTSAGENLAVTQTTATWTLTGAAPQFHRVRFEYSSDGVDYSPLGSGAPTGNNWTLTGLNLPMGQNFFVRARGHYKTGYQTASESITESVRNVFLIAPPPFPTAVVSRKLHNGMPFDIDLPLSGTPGIECRSGGASNDYQVVFTFPSAVTFSGAAVTAGAGTVSSTSGGNTTIVTVNLTGLTNAQRLTVTLQGVSDGTGTGDVAVPMGLLIGDTNGGGTVNSGDTVQTRGRSGQAASASNFRSDVNTDGFVNSGDTLAVRSRSGTSLP